MDETFTFLWLVCFSEFQGNFCPTALAGQSSVLILLSIFAEYGWIPTRRRASLGSGEVCGRWDGGLHR